MSRSVGSRPLFLELLSSSPVPDSFDFAVTTHQLVVWLMDCSHLQPSEPDLPNGFWQWLLIERGDAPEQA